MAKKLMISKLFPNKVLTNEEAEWVRRYYGFFGFEPIETEMVVDEVTFIAMVKKNVIWLEDFVNDGINSIEKNARELPYYEKVVYSNATPAMKPDKNKGQTSAKIDPPLLNQ